MRDDTEGGNIYQKHDAVALDNIYSSKINNQRPTQVRIS